jgi:hypothetical protein
LAAGPDSIKVFPGTPEQPNHARLGILPQGNHEEHRPQLLADFTSSPSRQSFLDQKGFSRRRRRRL